MRHISLYIILNQINARALIGQSAIVYLTNKEAKAVYYTVIKHDGHLRTRGKCRKHEPQASVFYISRVFSNVRSVLSQCNTRKIIKHAFSMLIIHVLFLC